MKRIDIDMKKYDKALDEAYSLKNDCVYLFVMTLAIVFAATSLMLAVLIAVVVIR
jgi:hypothetical protein